MTRAQLRIFFNDWFCGCGNPEQAATTLLRLLDLHPLYEHGEEFWALFADAGVGWMTLYTLDHYDLTEHGGNVGGAWLTDKGKALRDGLRREADDLEALFGDHCIHGVDDDDDSHDCLKAGDPEPWSASSNPSPR